MNIYISRTAAGATVTALQLALESDVYTDPDGVPDQAEIDEAEKLLERLKFRLERGD